MSSGVAKTGLFKSGTNGIFDVGGPQVQFLTQVSDADDDFCVFKGFIPPGVIVPIHSHAERETFYVLDGELEALLVDRWTTLGPNDVCDVPGGSKHAWRNSSDKLASTIFVVPMRLARFFRDIAGPAEAGKRGPPSPEQLQRILELAHAYDYWLGGPEDNAAVGLSLG